MSASSVRPAISAESNVPARTIVQAIHAGATCLAGVEVEDPRLEAELLLRHTLGVSREKLYTLLREPLLVRDAQVYDALLTRRKAHEPTPYIMGHREFYGLEFACTPAALIPRQETELLVETALEWLQRGRREGSPTLVADIGTGTGAIAVSLAVRAPNIRVVAGDRSADALALARQNAASHGVTERIEFVQSDLLSQIEGSFDLILANLPYVPSRTYATLAPEIRDHEPKIALDAGRRGTAVIDSLLVQAPQYLREHGALLAEHAWNQGRALRRAADAAFPNARVETLCDFAGHERALFVQT